LGGGAALGAGFLVQLIWTPAATIAGVGAIDPNNPTAATGGDVVLSSQFAQFDGVFFYQDDYPEALASVTEPTFLSGNVYLRLFSTAAPTANNFFYGLSGFQSGLLIDQDPNPSTPNQILLSNANNGALFWGNEGYTGNNDPLNTWVQVVPEPSVFALAALGAAVIGIRRFRRS